MSLLQRIPGIRKLRPELLRVQLYRAIAGADVASWSPRANEAIVLRNFAMSPRGGSGSQLGVTQRKLVAGGSILSWRSLRPKEIRVW